MLTQIDKRVIYKEPLSDLVFEDETMNNKEHKSIMNFFKKYLKLKEIQF